MSSDLAQSRRENLQAADENRRLARELKESKEAVSAAME